MPPRIVAQLRTQAPTPVTTVNVSNTLRLEDTPMPRCFILSVEPRDADAPGYYDLRLAIDRLSRQFRSDPCVDRLCRKMDMTRSEVLRHFTPGAYIEPNTGAVSLNAGYDPGFDEGLLEVVIWNIVGREACQVFANRASAEKGTEP